ncbi:LOW QUALITY PROTEIN: TOG array regulator of axonemal microtubules protein 2 [Pluvialis apricaria]
MESLALCYRAGQCQESVTKDHAPVAFCSGSVPKFQSRYAALGGSIDSSSRFCGSIWTTEEEASFQSILTTQMKKQPSLRDGVGKTPYPRASSPLDDRGSKASVHSLSAGDEVDLSRVFHQALTLEPQEREVSSAALETIQIKEKLKMRRRRMSEGLVASQRGLTDCSDPKGIALKPVVCRSASQRLLVTSKPVPPIQNGLPSPEPSRMSNGEQEHGENGTGCGDSDGDNKELMSEGKGYKASLMPLYCEDGKKSLGVALIPPIPKSAGPSDGAPGSAAVPLPSSEHLVSQEALEMRPRSGSRSEEKTLEALERDLKDPAYAESELSILLKHNPKLNADTFNLKTSMTALLSLCRLWQGHFCCQCNTVVPHLSGEAICSLLFSYTIYICVLSELRTLGPVSPVLQHHGVGGVKSAGHLCEPVPPLTDFPLSQDKEMDRLVSPRLLSDDDLKDSNGRIHVTLAKSAQKKIQQKRMREMELLHREREREREKEKSTQLPTESVDPGDADEESSGPLPVNGTVPISTSTSSARRRRAGTALGKRVNGPSLPSLPVIQGGSFPRNSSANSLPAIALDFLEWGEEPESGDPREAKPFPNPEQAVLNALTWLSSDDWQEKAKGLFSIRRLAICHSEVLLCRLHDVSLAVTKEVNNLRSKVSRYAINTLGELFRTMKKHMDHEVDEVARVLLQKMGDTSEFIQKAASRSLGIMVGSVTPARAMTALMASGVQHRNVLVRKCAAEHLLTAMQQIGAEKLLSAAPGSTELLVRTLVKLAQDCHQDTRCYGRKMLNILMSHRKFKKYLKRSVPSRDLEDVMATIKQKETEDRKCEPPSAKDPKKPRNSGLMTTQDNLPRDGGLESGSDVPILPEKTVRRTSLRTAEETEQLMELYKLLTANEFRTRMEGVMLLLGHCKRNPQFISTNIVQIFDVFVLRLQDCNKKVNQHALEALALMITMLRGAFHPVLVSLVAAVTENLNSKHLGIYGAAVKALEASIAHLDNALLLQALAHQARYLSGQALLIIAEYLSGLVASVYPWKPQAVKRYALPTLWFFLENRVLPVRSGNVRAVVAKFANSLYNLMGARLKEHAARQPHHVVKNLGDVLELNDW